MGEGTWKGYTPPRDDSQFRARAVLGKIGFVRDPHVVEIGVYMGDMSVELLKRPDLRLLMVDSWTTSPRGSTYHESGDPHSDLRQEQQDSFEQHARDAVAFAGDRARVCRMTSLDAAQMYFERGEQFDLVFIDAEHSYEATSADIRAWAPLVRAGGWISGHDYGSEWFPKFGVKRAVDEFVHCTGRGLLLGDNMTWFVQL